MQLKPLFKTRLHGDKDQRLSLHANKWEINDQSIGLDILRSEEYHSSWLLYPKKLSENTQIIMVALPPPTGLTGSMLELLSEFVRRGVVVVAPDLYDGDIAHEKTAIEMLEMCKKLGNKNS